MCEVALSAQLDACSSDINMLIVGTDNTGIVFCCRATQGLSGDWILSWRGINSEDVPMEASQ